MALVTDLGYCLGIVLHSSKGPKRKAIKYQNALVFGPKFSNIDIWRKIQSLFFTLVLHRPVAFFLYTANVMYSPPVVVQAKALLSYLK